MTGLKETIIFVGDYCIKLQNIDYTKKDSALIYNKNLEVNNVHSINLQT